MSDVEVVTGLGRLNAAARAEVTQTEVRRPPAINWRRLQIVAALAAGDAVTALGAVMFLSSVLRFAEGSSANFNGLAFFAPAALLICLSLLFGLYETSRSNPVELFRLRVLVALVFAAFVTVTLGVKLELMHQLMSWPSLVLLVVVLGSAASGFAQLLLVRLNVWQTRVVLVGDLSLTRALSTVLDTTPELGMRVLARVSPDDPRLLNPASLTDEPADLAILMSCGDGQEDARMAAGMDFPSVIIAHEAGDMQTLWLNTRTIWGAVGIEIRRWLFARNLWMKRIFDLSVGLVLLICSLPVIGILAFAVWSIDRHNPFYAQSRIGREGRVLRVWKVRSMFVDAEARLGAHLASDAAARAEWARGYKLMDDPRILPGIGHFIRRSSLDELPQLWNVVRGEMSLVGPRPFPAYHLASFDESFRTLRASVTPGLTGFWQITSRSDGDLATQKHADTFYVRNWSIWFDLYILFHTLPAVLFGKGAR